MLRKIGTICAAVVATATMLIAPAPAQASNNDGIGELQEFVQWWDPSFTQSCYDEFFSLANYSGKIFRSTGYCPGLGAGQNPANNQFSVANFDPNFRVVFWTGPNFTGLGYTALRYAECPASNSCYAYATLGSWNLNIESHYFTL